MKKAFLQLRIRAPSADRIVKRRISKSMQRVMTAFKYARRLRTEDRLYGSVVQLAGEEFHLNGLDAGLEEGSRLFCRF